MTVPWLNDEDLAFPLLETALTEPNGLLAVGGDLSIDRLRQAYRQGIFPWYEEGGPIFWWSPDPRYILVPSDLKISRSLKRTLSANKFKVSCNLAFDDVVNACGDPRVDSDSTWITSYMEKSYSRLHKQSLAHSIEVWLDGKLVGGLYGIAIGKIFFGESMFHQVSDASKVALAHLSQLLVAAGFPLIDCQVHSDHLVSMGAVEMNRSKFKDCLDAYTILNADENLWLPRLLGEW